MVRRNIRAAAILAVLLLAGFLPGCEGEDGPAGPSLTGQLIGYAYLYDLAAVRATDQSGITVVAEGTSVTATTASDGRWVLSGLPTGTYTIAFSKPGYGSPKRISFQFVGGGQTSFGSMALFQLPGFTIGTLTATVASGVVNIRGTVTGSLPDAYRVVRIFIGTTASVSSDPSNYAFTMLTAASDTGTIFTTSATSQIFANYGFTVGQTAYIVAYPEAISSSAYLDLSTGKYNYPNLNPIPSTVVSAVVP